MLSIIRTKFLHHRLSAAELDSVAALWRNWFLAAQQLVTTPIGYGQWRIEARVSGFPESANGVIRAQLHQILASLNIAEVRLLENDTVAAVGNWTPVNAHIPPLAAWCDAITRDATFDLCVLMLRLSIEERNDNGKLKSGQTLVLFGLISQHVFDLKAVWPAGNSGTRNSADFEKMYHSAAWPDEAKFLVEAAATRSSQSGVEIPVWAKPIFGPIEGERLAHRITVLIAPPLSHFTLRALFAKFAWFGALLLGAWTLRSGVPVLSVSLFIAAVMFIGLYLKAAVARVVNYHRAMKAGFAKLYSHDIAYPEIDLAQPGVLDEPSIRKHSADILEAGCSHWKDIRLEPAHSGDSYIRLFITPRNESVIALLLLYATPTTRQFPYKTNFLVTTRFADGFRAASSSHPAGFRKPLDLPVIGRSYGDIRGAADILARHQKLVEKQIDKGRAIAPVQRNSEVAQMELDHNAVRPLAAARGYYTWEDAFRESFSWKRKEQE